MFGIFKKKNPAGLLKKATASRQSGNLEDAISLLRTAYKEISKGDDYYGVETFLRLPLYLQEAGKVDEAWNEFKNLLQKVVKDQSNDTRLIPLIPMDHSTIYDKMRLFLQREGKNEEAVKYGIFSHFSRATGLFLQKRRNEFKEVITAEVLDGLVKKLLKKADKIFLSEQISNLIKHEVKNIPNIDYDALGSKVDKMLSLSKS